MKLLFFLLIIVNILSAEATFLLNRDAHDCISELPLECEGKPLSECTAVLTPICEECKTALPTECVNKPLNECTNLPTQCKSTDSTQPVNTQIQPANTQTQPADTQTQPANTQTQPADTQTQPANTQTQPANTQTQPANTQTQPANTQTTNLLPTDGTDVQTPHDCVHEIPIECENSPLAMCQSELTPVCEECKLILPPDCKDKPLGECNNPPPQCKQPPPPAGTQIPPPKADECSNENAGVYHPDTLEVTEQDNKTTLDIPRNDGGSSGFEIDSEGNSVIGIKPPAEKPPLQVEAPPCAQVEMNEDGSFNQYFNTDDGVQAELNASANGNFELKLQPPSGKNMEFKAPTGSNVVMNNDGSIDDYFSNEAGESELNVSKSGEFELKLKPAKKPPSKVKAPPGAKVEMAEDGSFKNYIAHDNGIEHELDSSNEGDFDFTFKHPKKKGFNFRMPPGSDIELQENGAMKQTLTKDTKRVEFDANENGEFNTKLELQGKDINKTREFVGVDGSDINMGEDTNVTSTYYDYNNSLAYNIKIDENSTMIATISKIVPKKLRATLGVVEYLQEDIVTYEMGLTYLDGGLWVDTYSSSTSTYRETTTTISEAKIDANYTTDSEFSIDIDENLTILFSPIEKSTFKEVTFLDKSKEIDLLSGKCNITIEKDCNITLKNLSELKVNSSGIYIKDNLDTENNTSLTLENGWNLISIPVSALINLDTMKSQKVWSYQNKWIEDPTFLEYKNGYWAFLDSNITLNFEGFVYDVELSNLKTNSWHLLGSGLDLTPKKDEIIYVFRNNEWIKNPEVIYKGEGFWIKK